MTLSADHAVRATLGEPQHDGSDLCLLEQPDELGGTAVVRVRVPRGAADRVVLRFERDGEPRSVEGRVDEEDAHDTWWRADFPLWNPVTRYRFLLSGGSTGYAWLNGLGLSAAEVADSDDYVLTTAPGGPDWHLGSVVYQIFPDRFASSGLDVETPAWAVPRAWGDLPTGRGPATPRELYGGDLRGVTEHLDHVDAVGANVIYLTPFFPASSNHRYDATTFGHVDPLLGGDEALRGLCEGADARGIRVLGDLTLNHTGREHEWFVRARADEESVERGFYYFDDALPGGYESWLGHQTLPKLDWRSAELHTRFAEVLKRYLELGLSGWRIDVANMVGRYRDIDLNQEVSRWTRAQVGDTLLVAEHGHDFRPDLAARGWHGVMNYSGFMRPLATWLLRDDPHVEQLRQFWGIRVGIPRLEGPSVVEAMRQFRAGVPWSGVLHSWNVLDSHDVARFRTVAGRDRHLVGVGLQMTTPGVPMVFAGDELGLEGAWGEDARRTMPWDDRDAWDTAFLAEVAQLARLRRSSEALARGGIRYVHISADAIAFLRETRAERLLCLAARADHDPISTPFTLETLYGEDAPDGVLPSDGPAFHIWRVS